MPPGLVYDKKKPIKRKPITNYFIKGWWTDINDKPITEALFGDTVRFHVDMQNTTNGDEVFLTLYDYDSKVKPLEEDHKDDAKGLVYTVNGKAVISDKVNGNKIVKQIILNNFEDLLKDEKDGEIELFFKGTYKDEKEIPLPSDSLQYLKVKGMPKIIFVNGQWRLAKYGGKTIEEIVNRAIFPFIPVNPIPIDGENFGPTQPKKPYWYDGNEMIDYAKIYFKLNEKYKLNNKTYTNDDLESKKFILYYDGSSYTGADQSGANRFANGREFAKENFNEIVNGLGGNEIYLISHSEGGAYAAGMADYLHSKGIKIGEHILLSPDEGDEFSINPEIPSFQLTYMFFSSIWNPTGTIINYEKTKIANKKFRRWGKYYAIVDWVTNEFKIKGSQKMGIVRLDYLDWGSVHGSTNDKSIFNQITDLKEVTYYEAIGTGNNGETYSGKDQSKTKYGTKFYRIDNEYISVNCPPISKIE